MSYKSEAVGREWLELSEQESGYQLKGLGSLAFLRCLQEAKQKANSWSTSKDLTAALSEFGSNSTFDVMMREVLLKATGGWQPAFTEDELCHCRVVPTEIVDAAIVAGAHTPEEVSRQTNASTQCGTCRPDVEKILAARLLPGA
ncbi:MAG: (2Fe-2S)-binding protein [Pseudomonadota bacterium]